MTTPTNPSLKLSASGAEHEEIWSLIVLQSAAAQSRLLEFHQQIEYFIQQTGEHPLTGEKHQQAVHDPGAIPLREKTTSASAAPLPLLSDFVVQLTRDVCDARGCVRDTDAMAQFTKRIEDPTMTNDDRVQALFVLDISFTAPASASAVALLSAFEKDGGYGELMTWFQLSCTYSDDANKSLSQLLLQFLTRHKPALAFSRKTVLTKLRSLQGFAIGRATKSLIKDTIEKYREV